MITLTAARSHTAREEESAGRWRRFRQEPALWAWWLVVMDLRLRQGRLERALAAAQARLQLVGCDAQA